LHENPWATENFAGDYDAERLERDSPETSQQLFHNSFHQLIFEADLFQNALHSKP